MKSLNQQFREIKFPANTIFLRDRAKIEENKVVPWDILKMLNVRPTNFKKPNNL